MSPAQPGNPDLLGATWDGQGVNFALFSENATAVDLCLFDRDDGRRESSRVPLARGNGSVWNTYVPGLGPGQLYGYRVHGSYDPHAGHRFNPAKLLLDPYARAIFGRLSWQGALAGYQLDEGGGESPDGTDSAPCISKCIVVDGTFDWEDDRPPGTHLNDSLIYECHLKGMTMRHPDVPEEIRGKYLGMASEPIIEHLLSLGVTAVELLPVQQWLDEGHLMSNGLVNYWGYSSAAFFAPEARYAVQTTGEQVIEFKSMVKALHLAGIEVILDVVYNHTAEGNHRGPTFSLKGVDNRSYYRLEPDDPRYYMDFTGTGNTVKIIHPRAMDLVIDSLRYWATEMHVDGFRFDLAPVLARGAFEFDPMAPFFSRIREDPVLSGLKLIAEPWDAGPEGYQLGRFPAGWSEWNDRYRDTVRRFWRGDTGQVSELATRLCGSSDLYERTNRGTSASVNFVTSHDGFTLHDLVSYSKKDNWPNLEQNRDGHDLNYSSNWGKEGPSHSPRVRQIREQIKRNFIATLMFSQGVRMILGGDELGRSQNGNNNAYCQDNEIRLVEWHLEPDETELLEFTRKVVAILRSHPLLRRRTFRPSPGAEGIETVRWLRSDGREMAKRDWDDSHNHVLGMLLYGDAVDIVDEGGHPLPANSLLLLLNGGRSSSEFVLPDPASGKSWQELLNTAGQPYAEPGKTVLSVQPHSLTLLEEAGPAQPPRQAG